MDPRAAGRRPRAGDQRGDRAEAREGGMGAGQGSGGTDLAGRTRRRERHGRAGRGERAGATGDRQAREGVRPGVRQTRAGTHRLLPQIDGNTRRKQTERIHRRTKNNRNRSVCLASNSHHTLVLSLNSSPLSAYTAT